MTHWPLDDLIGLVRRRYPNWDGFDHPPFVADEITYKQATISTADRYIALVDYAPAAALPSSPRCPTPA